MSGPLGAALAVTIAAVTMAAVTMAAGCGGHPAATADASPAATPVASCVNADEQRTGGFTTAHGDGAPVSGVVLGAGSTGVVLANQSNDDLCQWQPYGMELVGLGYRVALFDWASRTSTPDVLAALDALHAKGVRRVFLVGASMGGTAVLEAATRAQPPVAGVVDLSGPETYAGAGGLAAVKILTLPTLFIAGQYDTPFVNDTREMYAACVAKDKHLWIEPNGNHGVSLLSDKVAAMIEKFLKDH